MEVVSISSRQAMALVLRHHYSNRKVGTTNCYGLFEYGELVGCVCYSIPASYTLCKGVCGEEYKPFVRELSRLVVTTETKNAASMLIGQSLRMLSDAVVVSYADSNNHVGHVGYVYQATNWIYTGRGNAEPKWIDPRSGNIVSFTRRHIDRKANAIGLEWTDLIREPQEGKHRYVTFAGTRRFKRAARRNLKYKVAEYPKGETTRHEIDRKPEQGVLF